MPRVRTFIAVDPGKAVRDRLVAFQEKLQREGADVKWVGPENLHVTLLFLGEVDERQVPAVCQTVSTALKEIEPFELSIERTGCFPNMRRPRILWVGVGKGRQELVAVHDALEKPLLQLGCYRREERGYTPHITLGRIRNEGAGATLSGVLQKHQAFSAGEGLVTSVHVMSSDLTSEGPLYTVMSRAKLQAH